MKQSKCRLFGLFSLYLIVTVSVLTNLGCEPTDPTHTAPDEQGPYDVCSSIEGLEHPDYLDAKVFYPCHTESGPFAATTMMEWGSSNVNPLDWLNTHLASHGYIVMYIIPNYPGSPDRLELAHKAGTEMLISENSESGSLIQGMVDTGKLQISGFSKGGGAALLASADLGSQIASTIAMAPYMESTDAYDLSTISSSTMILIGNDDPIAPAADAEEMYNSLPDSIERLWGLFEEFNHLNWINYGSEAHHDKAKTYITSWMKVYLDGDTNYDSYLDGSQRWFDDYARNADTGTPGCN